MSIDFLMALMSGAAPVTTPAPVVSGVTATEHGSIGCSGGVVVNDTVTVAWAISNPNASLYYTNVLRNGVKRNAAAITNTTTSYSDTLPGSLFATRTPTNVSYTYTVEVRQTSNNALTSTASASALALTLYTACGVQA